MTLYKHAAVALTHKIFSSLANLILVSILLPILVSILLPLLVSFYYPSYCSSYCPPLCEFCCHSVAHSSIILLSYLLSILLPHPSVILLSSLLPLPHPIVLPALVSFCSQFYCPVLTAPLMSSRCWPLLFFWDVVLLYYMETTEYLVLTYVIHETDGFVVSMITPRSNKYNLYNQRVGRLSM